MAVPGRPDRRLLCGARHPAGLGNRSLPDRRDRQRSRPRGHPVPGRRPPRPLLAAGPDIHPAAPFLRGPAAYNLAPDCPGACWFTQLIQQALPEQFPLRISVSFVQPERVAERLTIGECIRIGQCLGVYVRVAICLAIRFSDAEPFSVRNSDANTHTNADANTDAYTDTNPDAHAHPNTYAYADAYPHAHAYTDTDPYPDTHANTYPDTHADAHADAHSHSELRHHG